MAASETRRAGTFPARFAISAEMKSSPLPFGLILAGGYGRRMGETRLEMGMAEGAVPPARPLKPLVLLGDKPLIGHVIARLRPQVSQLLINANEPTAPFAAFGLPIIADNLPGRPGPLAGVLAGLDWLALNAPEAPLLTVPADTPFLPTDLVERLMMSQKQSGRISCAASNGQNHHVIALWPASVRGALRVALEAGNRKVGAILDTLQVVSESWDGAAGDPFFNVNTAEDLAVARLRLPAE